MDQSFKRLNTVFVTCFIISNVSGFKSQFIYSSYEYEPLVVPTLQPVEETLKLTVFYESLCPDSINFFVNQLRPAYLYLNRYIDLDLVPFGNAQQNFTDGHWIFTCQHGPLECDYNKLHACALTLVKQKSRSYKFISCLMVDKNEESHLRKCAAENMIKLDMITKCRKSIYGDITLSYYGNRTHSFDPPITSVPTVAFNGTYTEEDENEALLNLPKVICRLLKHKPRFCEDYLTGHTDMLDNRIIVGV